MLVMNILDKNGFSNFHQRFGLVLPNIEYLANEWLAKPFFLQTK